MIAAWTRTANAFRFRVWTILFAALCLPGIQGSLSLAQVTTAITPSGLNTSVTRNGSVYDITGGTRQGGGPNLFHSFGEFSVGRPDTAKFLNTTPDLLTSNILGRVTGGNPSSIFGTIDTLTYPGANLFLMNPAGIVFGPNAQLNVGGAVNFTTADYLRFSDGVLFNAVPNAAADALLSSAPVAAFGFLGSNPGAITNQGSQLSVPSGTGISLVGGNITVQSGTLENGTVQAAQLSAPGGRINLASVASPGEILAGTLDQAPNVNGQSFGALGTIQVSQKSVVDASGDGGGTVVIRGGRFVLEDSRASANTTGPTVGPLVGEPGAGIDIQVAQNVVIKNKAVLETNVAKDVAAGIGSGGVRVKADRIEILGVLDFVNFPFTGIRSNVAPNSTGGRSGDIRLEANSVLVKDLGEIQANTEGVGDAGNITVKTNGNLELDLGAVDSGSFFASGNSGSIELTSTQGNILFKNFAFVNSQTMESSGNAGTITLSAPGGDILLADGTQVFNATRGTGALGGVRITANNLALEGFSVVGGDNFSPLPPGDVTVTLSGTLSLGGNSFIRTGALSVAPSSNLNITAHDIRVADGGFLSTESLSSGHGGVLNIRAENIQLTNGGQFSSRARRSGNGGSVIVQGLASPATSVLIDGAGSGIFTDARGTGAGGNINVAAQSMTVQNGGAVSASTSGTAPSATGGSIAIRTGQSVTLKNGASITASSTGPANAGNIDINAGVTFLATSSSVTTQAAQAGGGNIAITASDIVQLINSQINTSVAGGAGGGGTITIDPNFVILQNSQILANAFAGPGGNITITTGVFLADASSLVDASSQFGLSGTVTIQSPTSNLSAVWARLQQNYSEAAALLRARCVAQVSGQYSSFVQTGRDAIPLEPGGWLLSPLALEGTAVAPPVAQDLSGPELTLAGVGLRGFDHDFSWPGLGKMPSRFASVLDSACGS